MFSINYNSTTIRNQTKSLKDKSNFKQRLSFILSNLWNVRIKNTHLTHSLRIRHSIFHFDSEVNNINQNVINYIDKISKYNINLWAKH